ncbi:hypothetical protein D3C76_1800610 [compost metagenome]
MRNHDGHHFDIVANRTGHCRGVSIWFGIVRDVQEKEKGTLPADEIFCGACRSA